MADAAAEFVAAEQVMLDVLHNEPFSTTRLREVAAEKDVLVGKLKARIRAR